MEPDKTGVGDTMLPDLNSLLPELEAFYRDLHAHPELSMQERRTAGLAASRLTASGFEVTTGIGKTGVVGILRNGDGDLPGMARERLRHAADATSRCANGHDGVTSRRDDDTGSSAGAAA